MFLLSPVLILSLEIDDLFPENVGIAQAFITFSTSFAIGFTINIAILEAHSTYPVG